MILKNRLFLFLTLFFFFASASYSQDTNSPVPLKIVFEQITKKHRVKFNYIDSEVESFKIEPPAAHLSLKEKLDIIRVKTGLLFKQSKDYSQ